MASTHAFIQALLLGALLFLTGPSATAQSLETGGTAELKEVQKDAFQPLISENEVQKDAFQPLISENEVPEDAHAVSAANSVFVANGDSQSVCPVLCNEQVTVNFYSEATGYKGSLWFQFVSGVGVSSKCSNDGIWCVNLRNFGGRMSRVDAQFRFGGRTSPWVTLRGRAECSTDPGPPRIRSCLTIYKDTFFNF